MNLFLDLFFRLRVVLFLATVLATAAACYGLSQLKFNDNLADVLKADHPDYHALQQFFRDFGADDMQCVIVLECEDFFTEPTVKALRKLQDQAGEVEGVAGVYSMLDARRPWGRLLMPVIPMVNTEQEAFDQAREFLQQHPLVAGRMLSKDGKTALFLVRLEGATLPVSELRPPLERLEKLLRNWSKESGVRARITGIPSLRVDIYQAVRRDQALFTLIGAGVSLLIAIVLFRRFAAVVIVTVPPLVGGLWVMGAMGLAGESINTLNSILPALVLVVGFTDSVHFMVEARRHSSRKTPPQTARAALRHLLLPCGLTSLTTAVGFGSLALARIEIIQQFGVACSVGAILNFFAVMTLAPLLTSTPLGAWIGGPTQTGWESRVQEGFRSWTRAIIRRAKLVAILGVAATAALFVLALQLKPTNRIGENLPNDTVSYTALQDCDRTFGGTLDCYIVLDWPEEKYALKSPEVLQALRDIHELAEQRKQLSSPLSVLSVLSSLPRGAFAYLERFPEEALQKVLRRDLGKAAVNVQAPDIGAQILAPIFQDLDDDLQALQKKKYPDFQITLTGSAVASSRNLNMMIVDLCQSLGLAAAIIFVTITIALRSFRSGLISILPNVFPLVFVAASLLVIRGGALELSSVIMFSICLGIAVDDTIHFISRFHDEQQTAETTEQAVENSVSKVGSALLITTLTLTAGFGSGFFSALPALQTFSVLACMALLAALAADLIILPALLACLGKRRPEPQNPKPETQAKR